ncbi:hypothetical protein BJV82DRAFT_585328 [Fennellomyces sp. T-0311]|nr:hypothetical protein BJV82DRAFT_585328 [Fennellomyces sp. T-0311]
MYEPLSGTANCNNSPVRCCNTCDTLIQMQQMNSANLLALTPKQLKKYISAYNLPAKSAIEKDDLVRIILNTRPISNDSEIYYRTHRAPPPQPQPEQETSSSSPISNFIDNIFGGPSQKKQQREYEEQYRRQQEYHRQQQAWQQQQQQEQARRQQEQARQQQEQVRRQQEQARQQQEQARRRQEEAQRQQQEEQRRRQQQSPPSTRNNDMLSLDDMIRSKIDPSSLSVRTLKAILKANFVEQSHALEKSDLVSRVERLANERKKELADREGGSAGSDDTLCRICCDAQQNCVFLDCGHMVTCMDCGKQLVSSKNECPICREPILKLVHVFRS